MIPTFEKEQMIMKFIDSFGSIVRDIPPQNGNPRNSEGAFLTLSDGGILFAYSRFKGNDFTDCASADICVLYSYDGGQTFDDGRVILTCEDEKAVNIMSLSLLNMQNGDIGLFYLVRSTYSIMRMYLRRSSDQGKSWSDRILCTPQEGFFVVNNDRVVRLSSGRLIIPAAVHRKGYQETPDEVGDGYFDSRAENMFFISDDDGRVWRAAWDKCVLSAPGCCQSGLQEPGVIELLPGVLWGWARTDLGRQYEMFSFNGGENWTSPQPARFTSPNSPLSMKRGGDGKLYAVWNPVPLYIGRSDKVNGVWNGGRAPMVIASSADNGTNFSEPVAFETDEECGYCYCALHFTEDSLLMAYCAGGVNDGACLTRTRIRRVSLEELSSI